MSTVHTKAIAKREPTLSLLVETSNGAGRHPVAHVTFVTKMANAEGAEALAKMINEKMRETIAMMGPEGKAFAVTARAIGPAIEVFASGPTIRLDGNRIAAAALHTIALGMDASSMFDGMARGGLFHAETPKKRKPPRARRDPKTAKRTKRT